MTSEVPTIPNLPNCPQLRMDCLCQFWMEPSAVFSDSELDKLTDLFDKACKAYEATEAEHHTQDPENSDIAPVCDWRLNPGFLIIERDVCRLSEPYPKWPLLCSWLAPESAVGYCPQLVFDITRMAMSKLPKTKLPVVPKPRNKTQH